MDLRRFQSNLSTINAHSGRNQWEKSRNIACVLTAECTYRVLCVLAWLRDLSIHHSPWSAVSRGEDGSSKLGPCGQIRLPLSCVWHRRWISVSPTTQTSEDPWSIWAGDAFTSPPLRFTLCPLLGHCLTRRVWGQYFPLSSWEREGGSWGGRVAQKEGGYQCTAASCDEAVKGEAVDGFTLKTNIIAFCYFELVSQVSRWPHSPEAVDLCVCASDISTVKHSHIWSETMH